MYPHERSLVKRMHSRPFALLGVNSDEDREALKQTMQEEEITWRSWWDGGDTGGPIAQSWEIAGWPTLFLIDHEGVIRHQYIGSPDEEKLDAAIDELVEAAESSQ